MSLVYLGLGSNLGDKLSFIEKGLEEIEARSVGTVLRSSNRYRTKPIDASGDDFVNCTVEIMTDLEPNPLLEKLREIEEVCGRKRTRDKNSPRTLDIDILLYDYIILNEPGLIIPHPQITSRLFLLKTLSEIRPDLLHPVYQKSVGELLKEASPEVLAQGMEQL